MNEEAGEESWSVSFASRADKDMDRLDPPVRQRVATGIERLADDDSSTDVRKLKGSDELRLRVGDWRVRGSGRERFPPLKCARPKIGMVAPPSATDGTSDAEAGLICAPCRV